MMATSLAPLLDETLARAVAEAPFLRTLAARRPEIIAALAAGGVQEAVCAGVEPGETGADVARALRRERQAVALAVALGDLSGIIGLEEVVATLSDFADRAVSRALAAAFRERGIEGPVIGFTVLALGKHGSRELNYSSDIDPILLFDPDTLPRRRNEEPVEAAARIARRLVELLQARDADGHVFRVDLRLRPSPEATPPALPIDAAIAHYESSALPWERAAFIRARAAAGDIALGERFLAAIRPFVWRRGLGFGTVAEIRDISRRIRGHHRAGQVFGPGYDLKRGRGGIREVEFFIQIQQLIHGGRDATLRAPATLDALTALAEAGHVDRQEAEVLATGYRLFRTIEHRLQMIDDRQTHSLPREAGAIEAVARLDGNGDGTALLDRLYTSVKAVGRIYDSLDPAGTALPDDATAVEAVAAASGFADPGAVRARIDAWRAGTPRSLRTVAAQKAMEAALPALIAAVGAAPDPDAAFSRLDRMVSGLPTAIDFFRLLEARPALGRLMADILVVAPALADQLGRRPALLDGLIDASALDPPPSVAKLAAEFVTGEAGADYQTLLDRVRVRVNERRFALGTQLVSAAVDPLEVAAGYARVAEGAIVALAEAATAEFMAAHGRVPGGELLILALGRLGGGALTHASDLDLIYLFTGDHLSVSDGPRPIGATTYFNRLAQRVTGALSVATAAGPLYEVDTRLRPSGAQGLLAVSTESFERYQRENAWTWEHMALARARPVFGSEGARAALRGTIRGVLTSARDPAETIADAARMRAEIAHHKSPAGPFDVKLVPGGLIDAEFVVHVLQLQHGVGLDPSLPVAIRQLAAAGLIDARMEEAHALLTRMLVMMRIVSPGSTEPPPASWPLVAAECRMEEWERLLGAQAVAQGLIAAEWARISSTGRTA